MLVAVFLKSNKMEEVKDFIQKLKDERYLMSQKLNFVSEHKFNKEADFIRNRIQVINTILDELESVIGGHKKGIDVKFMWFD